jgi:hypothetical protein
MDLVEAIHYIFSLLTISWSLFYYRSRRRGEGMKVNTYIHSPVKECVELMSTPHTRDLDKHRDKLIF